MAVDVEELRRLIVQRVMERLAARPEPTPAAPAPAMGEPIPVGISVRHVHLCREDLDILYGPGYELTPLRELYQPGEFAAREVVTVVGPRLRSLADVRILAPLRKRTQVELAQTDCIVLGIRAPVRPSGQLDGAAPITLVGPKGSVTLPEAAIRANRHIHMSPQDAERFAVKDNDLVMVRVPGDRALIFENVQIRVGPKFVLQLHIDTDDANAADIQCAGAAYLLGKQRAMSDALAAGTAAPVPAEPVAAAAATASASAAAAAPATDGALRLTAEKGSRVVVTQVEVQQAAQNSKRIIVPAGAIVTPLAAELALQHGVTIEHEG